MNILKLIATIIILYLFYRIAKHFLSSSAKKSDPIPNSQRQAITEDLVEDPYCRTYLPLSQAYRAEVDGKTVYFCSEKCCKAFLKEKNN